MSRRRDIASVFASERDRYGVRIDGSDDLGLGGPRLDPLTGGDPEVRLQDAAFVGEEAPGSGQAIPGQDAADAAGDALGVSYGPEEPILPEKFERRDLQRQHEIEPSYDEDPER